MEAGRARSYLPRLTLSQMLKLVIFAAAASLCLAPMVRLAEAGIAPWPYVLMGEGVAIPLVLAIVAFPLVRAGPGKDRLIRVLLLISCGVALGVVVPPLFGPSPLWGSGATRASMIFAVVILSLPTWMLFSALRARS